RQGAASHACGLHVQDPDGRRPAARHAHSVVRARYQRRRYDFQEQGRRRAAADACEFSAWRADRRRQQSRGRRGVRAAGRTGDARADPVGVRTRAARWRMRDWLRSLSALLSNGSVAVVSVLSAEGSTPREAGARMLVTETKTFGTIGGGALEFAAIA